MSFLTRLSFGFGRRLPIQLQTEGIDTGLGCVAMIATYYGYPTDAATLRQRFEVSLKGMPTSQLMQIAAAIGLGSRPVHVGEHNLKSLQLPCIVQCENHLLVLRSVGSRSIVVHDPMRGQRRVPLKNVLATLGGVAIELWPNASFRKEAEPEPIKLRQLVGKTSALYSSLAKVLTLALALEVASLPSPLLVQWVVDNAIASADQSILTTLALGFLLLLFTQLMIRAARVWAINRTSTLFGIQWQCNLFSHLIRLPLGYFEKRKLGDIMSRFDSVDQILRTLSSAFFEALIDGVFAIAIGIVLFFYSPMLATIVLGFALLYAVLRLAWYEPLFNASAQTITSAARQRSHFLETVRGVRTIKMFQHEEDRRAGWLSLLVDQTNNRLRLWKLNTGFELLRNLLTGVENVVVVWISARMVMDGTFSVGALLGFNAYRLQFDTRVTTLIDRLLETRVLRLHRARIADIAVTEPEIDPASAPRDLGATTPPATIATTELRFRFADREPYVLDGVSLAIGAGESVVVTGPSGCGKSTLIHLFVGLLAPTEGNVLVCGTPVAKLGLNNARSMMGVVLQDDVLFAGSLAENISFFDPQADRKWIEECARLAAIHPEIAAMPLGYDSLVGEMGTVLSGGQKQRVLIARALYKRPRILLMDEATSHLDVERERLVNEAIRSLKLTRIIVAHRPQTIASADRCITLNGGHVVSDHPILRATGTDEPGVVRSLQSGTPHGT